MVQPDRTVLQGGLSICRLTTGLWQVADQERGGNVLNVAQAATILADYARTGFDTFDMADHYGSAERIVGAAASRLREAGGPLPVILTKWCPEPGEINQGIVRRAVETALRRLEVERIDLMQLHWWQYESPAYLEALVHLTRLREEGLIRSVGLTDFDTNHLQLVLAEGIEIATNQVCYSLLDRRAQGRMAGLCGRSGVKILAYGTHAGGLLSNQWLGRSRPDETGDWSRMKYLRLIRTAGGWARFQELLACLANIASKHEVSIANVATRWVLQQEHVAAAIVGVRLGESDHRDDNARIFGFGLDKADMKEIEGSVGALEDIPGDCGDEYRKPSFHTASGDPGVHLDSRQPVFPPRPSQVRPERTWVSSGTVFEARAGYSRAIRVGNRILVSGTTAIRADGSCIARDDATAQTIFIADRISAALLSLGGSLEDVVRTRIFISRAELAPAVAAAHRSCFGPALPANTLVVAGMVGDFDVEIEAEAMVQAA